MIIYNTTRQTIIATAAEEARSFWRRTWGLIGRTDLPAGYGLVFSRCTGIHTVGMRLRIDVLFLDETGRVLRALPAMLPWRVSPIVWRSFRVIELPAGVIARTGTRVGDQVTLEPAISAAHLPAPDAAPG